MLIGAGLTTITTINRNSKTTNYIIISQRIKRKIKTHKNKLEIIELKNQDNYSHIQWKKNTKRREKI